MLLDEIRPQDLPTAWNEKIRQYLDITPPDDGRGCLQDIHWSGGAIGYFPTYTLGNLYAAQFFGRRGRIWAISTNNSRAAILRRCWDGFARKSIAMANVSQGLNW